MLLDFAIADNTMTPVYAVNLGLKISSNNIGAEKIDGFTIETLDMVLASL